MEWREWLLSFLVRSTLPAWNENLTWFLLASTCYSVMFPSVQQISMLFLWMNLPSMIPFLWMNLPSMINFSWSDHLFNKLIGWHKDLPCMITESLQSSCTKLFPFSKLCCQVQKSSTYLVAFKSAFLGESIACDTLLVIRCFSIIIFNQSLNFTNSLNSLLRKSAFASDYHDTEIWPAPHSAYKTTA